MKEERRRVGKLAPRPEGRINAPVRLKALQLS